MNKILKRLRSNLDILIPLAALLLGVGIMCVSVMTVRQARPPQPMVQTFVGEYSYDQENWYPITAEPPLNALKGDLYLRGHWAEDMAPGSRLYFYRNHIGGEIYINHQLHSIDIILELEKYGIPVQPSTCSQGWQFWFFKEGITTDDLVEIRLHNPHDFGNENAYRQFLSTLRCTPNTMDYLREMLGGTSQNWVVVGVVFLIVALLLMGSAVASVVLRASLGPVLVKMGLLAGFTGGYFVFDTMGVNLWIENNLINTYGRQICMMYAVYLLVVLARDLLQGKPRRVMTVVMGISAAVDTVIVLASFTGLVLMYDTLQCWVLVQLLLSPALIGCCVSGLYDGARSRRGLLGFLMILFSAIVLDLFGVFSSMYLGSSLTKLILILFFAYAFFSFVRSIIRDYKASARAKKLEQELEESRIAIMLSQIQPHFLFNVLGTLRGLCREDPQQAWVGLGDFSAYLRGNMNALTNAKSVPFETELQHVEAYLRLEKMRLGEKLSIVYNIQDKDFHIPPLTLQPLVENAVKHGIFYKKNGGTLIIHSRRENGRILISVQDDGVGFDADKPEPNFEQHTHVGMTNVRNRVEKMLGGTLRVESELNSGTTVTLEFPGETPVTEGAANP